MDTYPNMHKYDIYPRSLAMVSSFLKQWLKQPNLEMF
jgi:hypothetical protein